MNSHSHRFEALETAEIVWRDGLPYSVLYEDIYFSQNGGVAETKHVFIDGNMLLERWQQLPNEPAATFVIAETGFGSGLNFLVTLAFWKQYAPSQAKLYYYSCEQHPITISDLKRCLALWPSLRDHAVELLENYPPLVPGFHQLSLCEGRVNLTLMLGDALRCYHELLTCNDANIEARYRNFAIDAWFLDGFAPQKNPAMWHEELVRTIAMLSCSKTTLATYSVASAVKHRLQEAGFQVTKKPGYANKREMLTAAFDTFPSIRTKRFTPWHLAELKNVKEKTAIVLGGGLAGCFVANALAKRQWSVTLIEEQTNIAKGASGNQQAILYPKLTAFRSPFTAFMLSAYLYACRTYNNIHQQASIGDLCGILQLAYNAREKDNHDHLIYWLHNYPELGQLVTAEEASAIAGINLSKPGLFLPHAGWIELPKICQHLISLPQITLALNQMGTELNYIDNKWHVNDHRAEVLIIANGHQASSFVQTASMPLKAIRGQMTCISSHALSERLKIPLCADGHILPARDGFHYLGATYNLNSTTNECFTDDDQLNLTKLSAFSTDFDWSQHVVGQWAGVRTAAPDYLPLVGPVPKVDRFKEQLKGLASNPRRWIDVSDVYHQDLYLCTGFGSRGLTMIPMMAEWLASLINNEPNFLPRSMIQSFSPARFLRKEMIRNNGSKF